MALELDPIDPCPILSRGDLDGVNTIRKGKEIRKGLGEPAARLVEIDQGPVAVAGAVDADPERVVAGAGGTAIDADVGADAEVVGDRALAY